MTAGQNIKAAREAAGISQTELAKRIGTTRQQIGKYETDKQDMTLNRLFQIASALGVEPDTLTNINIKQKEDTQMKMANITSNTWTKIAEIETDDFSIEGIARAINKEFGEPFFETIENAIKDGYIEICEDGIIIWMS